MQCADATLPAIDLSLMKVMDRFELKLIKHMPRWCCEKNRQTIHIDLPSSSEVHFPTANSCYCFEAKK